MASAIGWAPFIYFVSSWLLWSVYSLLFLLRCHHVGMRWFRALTPFPLRASRYYKEFCETEGVRPGLWGKLMRIIEINALASFLVFLVGTLLMKVLC